MFVNLKVLFFVFFSFIASCTSLPLESIKHYADAFQSAHNASGLLLDEVSPIVTASFSNTDQKNECGVSKYGYLECFDPALVTFNGSLQISEHPSITARRDALNTLSTYNQMLVELAGGKSITALHSKIDGLSNLIGTVSELDLLSNSGLPALIDPAAMFMKNFVGRIKQAKSNEAVKKAILESKSDIDELLNALADDSSHLYKVFRTGRESERLRLKGNLRIAKIRYKKNKSAANKQALDAATNRFNANVQSIFKFGESLIVYVQLLRATSTAIHSLGNSSNNTQITSADTVRVITGAVDLKNKANELKSKISEIRKNVATSKK